MPAKSNVEKRSQNDVRQKMLQELIALEQAARGDSDVADVKPVNRADVAPPDPALFPKDDRGRHGRLAPRRPTLTGLARV